MSKNPVMTATAHLASAHAAKDPQKIAAARQELAEAKLRRAVQEALAAFPPLDDDVKQSVAHLLTSGGA